MKDRMMSELFHSKQRIHLLGEPNEQFPEQLHLGVETITVTYQVPTTKQVRFRSAKIEVDT